MTYVAQGAEIRTSLPAGADLRTHQFKFVKESSGTIILCAAATDVPTGVLQNKPNTGETAEVLVLGASKVSADAVLAAGTLIGTSADGQADAKVPGTDVTEYVCGRVAPTDAAAAAGNIIQAFINCATPHRAA